jgi:hypothetical protein
MLVLQVVRSFVICQKIFVKRAKNPEGVPMRVNRIVMHQNPHLDELMATKLLKHHGEEKFPGVGKAQLVTWGKKELAANPLEMTIAAGSLLVGLGGGMFDEHGRDGERQDCATTLVAKHLGLMGDPTVGFLANAVFLADAKNDGPLKNLADTIKDLNRYWSGSCDLENLFQQFNVLMLVQIARREEYLEAKRIFKTRHKGRVNGITLAAAMGISNTQYQHAARQGGAEIIIQRDGEGHTQIFGGENLDMAGLSIRIRKAEMAKSKIRPTRFLNEMDLAARGTLADIPQWCYDHDNLLNGSESFTDVTPSKIDFHDLVLLVERHLAGLVR